MLICISRLQSLYFITRQSVRNMGFFIVFFKQLYLMGIATFSATNQELLVGILTLVDTALLAGLLLIIILPSYSCRS